jgi:hypothetical protein
MRLPILTSAPSKRELLVIEWRPEHSKVAYFQDSEGELGFKGAGQGDTPEMAFQALPEKPEKPTSSILGIPFSGLADSSTVVRFRRPKPEDQISDGEIKDTLAKVPPLDMEGEIFFEDLFNAKIDGLPTLDPGERSGEVVELNYYQASGPEENVHQAIGDAKKLGPDPTVIPTAYALSKLVSQANPKGALTLDIDENATEVSLTADGHLVGIKSFDLGGSSKELFIAALEAALEEMRYSDLWPEQIYLSGEITNYEEFRSMLLAYPWTKKYNMINFPKVELLRPVSVHLTLPADVGLNALSLMG